MLDCKHTHESLSDALDGALPWWRRVLMRVHLRVCPGCARTERSLRASQEALRGLRDLPPRFDDEPGE
jgi:anti-sigma factor RsiW